MRSRFCDENGKFDPGRLPLLEIEDRDGNVKLYLAIAWRLLWWSYDHPLGDPIRIVTEVVENAREPYVLAQIVDVRVSRYLRDPDGKISVIPSLSGEPQAAINPEHVLYSDRKMIVPSRRGNPTEKALTGAIGRVLSRAGYGTEGALELLEDYDHGASEIDEQHEIVDTPHERPRRRGAQRYVPASDDGGDAEARQAVLAQIFALADRHRVANDTIVAIARDIAGPNASSDTLSVPQLRLVLERLASQVEREAQQRRNEPGNSEGRRPRPRRAEGSTASEAESARAELLALQRRLGISNDEVIAALREVRGEDGYEPGDPLDAIDYIAAAQVLQANAGGAAA